MSLRVEMLDMVATSPTRVRFIGLPSRSFRSLRSGADVWAVFALALCLRLATATTAGIYHPDELFQYLEQGHRLLTGHGIVPWEFRLGIRSWIVPLALTPAMAAGEWLAPGTPLHLLLPRTCAALLSMTVVWSAWHFGLRRSRRHGLVAAVVTGCWAELVYLAPHVLSETASIALILPAAVLLSDERPYRLTLAGFLLGLAAVLRMQHAPAVVLLAMLSLRSQAARWKPTLVGIAGALAVSAATDVAMGQIPFSWLVGYVQQNVLLHRADQYGVSGPLAYPQAIGISFGWWTAPLLLLAAVGAKREPTLLRVAAANLAIHMLIGHKEYRFVLLTTTLLVVLAALGSGELVASVRRLGRTGRMIALPTVVAAWLCASASLALAGRPALYAAMDTRGLQLFTEVGRDPELCALATYATPFTSGGGFAYLDRAVPMYGYGPSEATRLRRDTAAFNRLVAPAAATLPAGFRPVTCQPALDDLPATCVSARTGGCQSSTSAAEINDELARIGQ